MTDEQKEKHEKSSSIVKKQRQDSLFTETPWFARSEYDWELSNRVLKRNNKGNKASNFFQQRKSLECRRKCFTWSSAYLGQ